jgi:hypothetical protein
VVLPPEQLLVVFGRVTVFQYRWVVYGDPKHTRGVLVHDRSCAQIIGGAEQLVEHRASEEHRMPPPTAMVRDHDRPV